MKQFDYTIKDEVGIHARPAGLLAKKAKEFQSEITIECNGKSTLATKLMAVMGLGVKCSDKVSVSVSGEDEEKAYESMKSFFESNL